MQVVNICKLGNSGRITNESRRSSRAGLHALSRRLCCQVKEAQRRSRVFNPRVRSSIAGTGSEVSRQINLSLGVCKRFSKNWTSPHHRKSTWLKWPAHAPSKGIIHRFTNFVIDKLCERLNTDPVALSVREIIEYKFKDLTPRLARCNDPIGKCEVFSYLSSTVAKYFQGRVSQAGMPFLRNMS